MIVMGERYEGYSAGAAWEDTKFGFEHLRGWKRTRARHGSRMGRTPRDAVRLDGARQVQSFPLDQKADAATWLATED